MQVSLTYLAFDRHYNFNVDKNSEGWEEGWEKDRRKDGQKGKRKQARHDFRSIVRMDLKLHSWSNLELK